MVINDDGCPCNERCCDEPDTVKPHDCDDACEKICEESFTTECLNCGRSCGCDL